jgi:hypothetical protein
LVLAATSSFLTPTGRLGVRSRLRKGSQSQHGSGKPENNKLATKRFKQSRRSPVFAKRRLLGGGLLNLDVLRNHLGTAQYHAPSRNCTPSAIGCGLASDGAYSHHSRDAVTTASQQPEKHAAEGNGQYQRELTSINVGWGSTGTNFNSL